MAGSPAQNMIRDLNQKFAVSGLGFEAGKGGLLKAVIDTPVAAGEIYLHGAHVAAWQPVGHEPVLWMSAESIFEAARPIRGGVPICFPWFGAHPGDPAAPAHGLARIRAWNVSATSRLEDGGAGIELQTEITPWRLSFAVRFGRELEMALRAELPVEALSPARFEAALHTYFHVGDIRQVLIEGLEGAGCIDKVDGIKRKAASGVPIQFEGETDRVYLGTRSSCRLVDPALKRTITVSKAGSEATVVWNPWIAKSARMADFGDEEWTGMVCIETANVADHAVELQPGQVALMQARLSVEGPAASAV